MIRSPKSARRLGRSLAFGLTCILGWPYVASFAQSPPANDSPIVKSATSPTSDASDPAEPANTEPPLDVPLDGRNGRELLLRHFRPTPKMKARRTAIVQPVSPVVDVHTHFGFKLKSNEQALDDFVAVMDANRIAVCVSLDGRLGSTFEDHRDFLWKKHKDRFVVFVHLDWKGQGEDEKPSTWDCHRPGFAKRSAERIHEAVTAGASGLKIFKRFGLNYKNPDGSLINIDDERWDPIWQACGEAKIPVIMHTADPAAFFDEVDATNERWEELSRHPDWIVQGSDAPSRTELLAARNRIIRRHPGTTFIGAHVANNSEDLKTVSKWLDEMPNLQVEFASRISELGRQPYTSRRFLIRYADRVMFGTDGPQPAARLNSYWRFLETRDENFPYSEKLPPPQGFWNIHGVGLPEEVLKKIYSENAARIIPGVSDRLRRFQSSEGS